MTTSDWVLAILTGVLVLTTMYYAWQTRQTVSQNAKMVEEMRLSREVQVTPKLIPAMEILGPNDLLPRVANMGLGAAIRVNVTLTLGPDGPSATYIAAFMSPTRGASVFIHGDKGRHLSHISEFQPFETFRMKGECFDAIGRQHPVDETFDLRGYIRDFKAGMWARVPRVEKSGDPLELIADALVNIDALMRREQEAN